MGGPVRGRAVREEGIIMGRMVIILIGLMLLLGAVGLYSYRAGWLPQSMSEQVTRNLPPSVGDRIRPREQRRATRSLRREERRADREARRAERQAQRDGDGWLSFENILDMLNLVVGVVGIWLAIMGTRGRTRRA
ncbi:MAG: hypothetical protein AAFR04_05085 [Pseudomonadota bacterium]